MLSSLYNTVTGSEINPSNMTGSIDVIVAKYDNNTYSASPFHVRFGKWNLLKPKDRLAQIWVNDEKTDLIMRLGKNGEGFFEIYEDNLKDYASNDAFDSDSCYFSGSEEDPSEQLNEIASPKIKDKSKPEDKNIIKENDVAKDSTEDGWIRWPWGGMPSKQKSKEGVRRKTSENLYEKDCQNVLVDDLEINIQDDLYQDIQNSENKGYFHKAKEYMFGGSAKKKEEDAISPREQNTENKAKEDVTKFKVQIENIEENLETEPSTHLETEPESKNTENQQNDLEFEKIKDSNENSSEKDINKTPTSNEIVVEEEDAQISQSYCKDLVNNEMTFEEMMKVHRQNLINFSEFCNDPYSVISHPQLMVKIYDNLYAAELGIPQVFSLLAFGQDLPSQNLSKLADLRQQDIFSENLLGAHEKKEVINLEIEKDKDLGSPLKSRKFFQSKASEPNNARVQVKRTQRLSSMQLESLNLKMGRNKIKYIIQSENEDESDDEAEISTVSGIYVMPYTAKIVISDVDGTITKSDVIGQIMPLIGRDWTHEGVANLLNSIEDNGYTIVYLTARAMSVSDITKGFIEGVDQSGVKLPDGPLMQSPDSLFASFKREVILKRPQDFKIAALRDLSNIFGKGQVPLFSGFGNRDTDAIAYRAVGINFEKIFIINPQGDVFQMNSGYTWNYKKLNEMVNEVFPLYLPKNEERNTANYDKQYDCNNYWKQEHGFDAETLLKGL